MNDRVKENSKNMGGSDFDLEDLTNLENELNGLVEDIPSSNSYKSNLFGGAEEKPSVKFSDGPAPTIGQSTADFTPETKTWDGYGKFNNIPMNPDVNVSQHPGMSKAICLWRLSMELSF